MKLENYKLPMHVAAALSSGRSQLLKLAPMNLDEEAQRELVRLLIDMIDDRHELLGKIEELREVVRMAAQTINGHTRRLEESMEHVR